MPRRTDIKSVLIIGAGPIIIGQACEFDYSGVQACKALREEGYKVILINSNPATIMTDPATADVTYIEPITWQTVERIIAKEKPDAILPTMGGQTALNCALDLWHHGVLEKYKVELIGAKPEAIDKAEAVIVCCSNPVTSIGPILAVPGIRDGLVRTAAPVVAVSPIVGGAAVSGPAGKLLRARGLPASAVSIAEVYQPWLDALVFDQRDAALGSEIERRAIRPISAQTLMTDPASEQALASAVLDAIGVRP